MVHRKLFKVLEEFSGGTDPKIAKNPALIDSFRPLSHLLLSSVKERQLINSMQCVFRLTHSTMDQIYYLQSEISSAISQKKHYLSVSLDISKAFEMAWRHNIMRTLYKWNFRGRLPKIIHSFLQNRSFQV